jgi:hypothetical protein
MTDAIKRLEWAVTDWNGAATNDKELTRDIQCGDVRAVRAVLAQLDAATGRGKRKGE